MVPADAASSPGFAYNSPKPRQVTKLAVAGPSGSRSAPQSPHTPTNIGIHQLGTANFNPDGSLSVVRNDDDANNSGLLDLSPALTRVIKSRPNFATSRPDGTPSTKRQPGNPRASLPHQRLGSLVNQDSSGLGVLPKRRTAKSRLSSHATFGEVVPSSQPAEDYLHIDPLTANGLATSSDIEAESQKDVASSSQARAGLALESADEADKISLDDDNDDDAESNSTLTRLRRWRQDAMQQHLYDTAIFWGSKVLSLETTAAAFNDAYHLAQCYFYTHQYARAEQLLTSPLRTGASHPGRLSKPPAASSDSAPYSAKQTGAEGFLASDNVQEDDDALHEVLQRTQSSSILPASIMARFTTKDSMYSATSSTTGKRKKRDFNVTATGTGSSETDSSGREAESDQEFLQDASSIVNHHRQQEDGSVVFRDAPKSRRESKKKAREPVDLQSDLEEVKQSTLAPAHGPILVNHSLACRYLAAQCQVRLGKYHEALDLLGETEYWGTSTSNKRPSADGGIKLGSSVAYLRGQIHLRLEDLPRARDSFMAALALDVKNYEAFSALIDGEMLGTEEQWSFIQSLEYLAQAGDEEGAEGDYELVRLLYTTQLSKQGKSLVETTARARRRLVDEYGLGEDADVLLCLAEELFSRLRFADAFVVTSRILELSADHPATLPIHIACTYHLKNLRPALFMLAHRLTELQPESPVSWYAVGTWYASTRRWAEARRYFSKASLLDPRFAAGWIAFGHTFALEGESDQAIIAYSTASRLFPQSHLPKLFVGMEHLHQDNLSLARLSLEGSACIWPHDPLLANERGIVAFQTGDLESASHFFSSSLGLAKETQHPLASWKATYLNLGLTLMRLCQDEASQKAFRKVVELDPHSYQAHLCLGMLAHKGDELEVAIQHYHVALLINPRDAFATELLDFVLEEKVQYGVGGFVNFDPQQRLGKGTFGGGDKGKGRMVEVDNVGLQRIRAGLESIPESASPTRYEQQSFQHQGAQDGSEIRFTAPSDSTVHFSSLTFANHSLPHPHPSIQPTAPPEHDFSTASAPEISFDSSHPSLQTQIQPHFHPEQSSVLMDESTS